MSMSRSLRALSVLTRPPNFSRPLIRAQHSLLRRNGNVRIQPVRLKKRKGRYLLHPGIIGLGLSIYLIYVWGLVDVEGERTGDKAGALSKMQAEDGDKANDGAQGDDKVDEDDIQVPETMPEDAIFIPLGFVRQRPHTHYNGSDPEWQSFVEFRKDPERSVAVQNELVGLVWSHLSAMGFLQRQIGAPMKLGRAWLDILIPYGPPPEYERSGLEITDDYIAWTTRPVSALQVARIHSALQPLPVAKSLWASGRTYCSLQLARLKQFLNIAPASSNTSPHLTVGPIKIDQAREDDSKQEAQARAQMNKMSDPKSAAGSTRGSANSASSDGSRIYGSLPSLPQFGSDIASTVLEFKRTLAKNWRSPDAPGERGTVLVRGDLELKGPKGSCVLEILADYHPQEARYVKVRASFKYFLPRRQYPRSVPEPKKSGP